MPNKNKLLHFVAYRSSTFTKYQCPMCDYVGNLKAAQLHMTYSHPGHDIENFGGKCSKCSFTCKTQKELCRHKKNNHPIKLV